ncbi:MAG: hypothetical protein RSC28_01440 [Bacteroidales bacterium]
MKYTTYIIIIAIAILSISCSKEEKLDPVIKAEREALLATSNIGFYKDGKPLLIFTKMSHQLVINPTQLRFRIQIDAADYYAEIKLSAFPTFDNSVKATIIGNLGVKECTLENVILLSNEKKQLVLWSDTNHMGFVLPWIEKK